MSRQSDIQRLIKQHHRNLQKLKEQQAALGLLTPPHISNEIEDITVTLERLQAELEATANEPTDAFSERDVSAITQDTSPAPARPRHNLPAQATPLIGRERQVAEIAALLR